PPLRPPAWMLQTLLRALRGGGGKSEQRPAAGRAVRRVSPRSTAPLAGTVRRAQPRSPSSAASGAGLVLRLAFAVRLQRDRRQRLPLGDARYPRAAPRPFRLAD